MTLLTDPVAIGELIATRLRRDEERLRREWESSAPVRHLIVDSLLPEDDVRELAGAFPANESLVRKSTLREKKAVGVDVRRYDPAIGAHLFAFQQPAVVEAVTAITGLTGSQADPTLYASGISVMEKGDYLRPHLDNSHDGDQQLYRVANLLFYVTPGWAAGNGGNLEVWDERVRTNTTIESRFNRLVVMETNPRSWHSVSPIVAGGRRMCVSNYYFSAESPTGREYHNVTSFIGRPEEPLVRTLLRLDSALLNAIGRAAPFLLKRNPHRLEADD
jgi:Rps23 Pro-64 3,4-dihydroxylase Tpa1-like proline 4-hydroxylase